MGMMVRNIAMLAATILVSGCSTVDDQPAHLIGIWGGPHIGLEFQGGLADVQFDCGAGTIDDAIFPAPDGAFTAKGTYRTGPPGPLKVGQIFKSETAVFSGHVVKGAAKNAPRTMALTIALEDGTPLGPFALTEGAGPQLTRCD